MARLPQPGSDNGTWGSILNDYLSQVHKSDGTLKPNTVTNEAIAPNSVTSDSIATGAVTQAAITSGSINGSHLANGAVSEAKLDSAAQAKLNAVGSTPDWSSITNKPAVIAAGATQADARTAIGAGTASTASDVGLGNVDNTSDANKPISSATQAALNSKANTVHTHTATQISDSTTIGQDVITAASAADARTAIGAGTASTAADVGLGNVDNTSDVNKPISSATQTALNAKSDTVHTHAATQISDSTVVGRNVLTAATASDARTAIGAGTSNLVIGTTPGTAKAGDYTPTASDVGLGNVNNTSDLNKPISTATQTALDDKADLVAGTVPTGQLPALALTVTTVVADQSAMLALTTGQVQPGDIAVRTDGAGTFILTDPDPSQLSSWTLLNAPTDLVSSVNGQTGTVVLAKGDIGLANVDNTSDLNKPISTATQTALDDKADLVGGFIPASQIPALALTNVVTVADQSAMLALTTGQVQPGDIAVRTDGAGTFILTDTDPSVLGNWTLLNSPTDVVTSVNGQTGVVSLTKGDVGLGNVDNTSDANKPISTATQTALDAKHDDPTGTPDGSKYLRDDNTWQPVPVAGNPDWDDITNKPAVIAAGATQADARTAIGAGTASTAADVGLGNVDNTSDANKPISTATQTALDDKADLVGGLIPTNQIPALAYHTAVTVADQSAMLALTTGQVQPGDIAVRTDGAGTFILTATDPSVLGNWTLLNAPDDLVSSVNGQTGTVVLAKSDVGLGNVDNTSDANKPISTATQTALDDKADLVGGSIPTAQIPALALTNTVTVANQSAMLALTTGQVQPGDIAVRTDGAGTFILTDTDPSVLGNWTLLNAPTDLVLSVNGQTGTVVLDKSDVGLGNVDNTSDANKPISTATQTALDGKYDNPTGTTDGTKYLRDDNTWQPVPVAGDPDWDDITNKPAVIAAGATQADARTAIGAGTASTAADVGLGNVDNTSDANKPISTATQTALDDKADLVGGLVPTNQLPALAFTETYVVADQPAMLALSTAQVQPGDIAVRTDGAGTFILTNTDPSVLGNWTLLNAPDDIISSVNGQTGTVVLAKGDVGLGNVDNTSDANKPISTATQTALDDKADLVGGLVPTNQIPALAYHTSVVVADQPAMLALTTGQVQPGDLAIRTDGAGTFILTAADPSVLGNWQQLNAPTDVVVSVNGQQGTVVLDKSDVGLGNVDNTSDANKPISTAAQTALDAKVDDTIAVATTNSLTGGGDLTTTRTLSLVNDSGTPGNSKYYGTNGGGTKGYFDLPAATNLTVSNFAAATLVVEGEGISANDNDSTIPTSAAVKDYVDSTGSGDASTDTATSVDSEVALFSGTGGKTLKRATGSGIATLTAGVLGAVTAPSGTIVGTSDNQVLTNKTINGPDNTLTNIAQSSVTNLTTDLAARALSSRNISTTNSITGGGNLTADRTLSLVNDSATPGNSKYYGTNGGGTKGFYDLPVPLGKYSEVIGDGVATAIGVTHNLGSRSVIVSVHDASTYEEVECDVVKTTTNEITLTFETAPASMSYVCTVIG